MKKNGKSTGVITSIYPEEMKNHTITAPIATSIVSIIISLQTAIIVSISIIAVAVGFYS